MTVCWMQYSNNIAAQESISQRQLYISYPRHRTAAKTCYLVQLMLWMFNNIIGSGQRNRSNCLRQRCTCKKIDFVNNIDILGRRLDDAHIGIDDRFYVGLATSALMRDGPSGSSELWLFMLGACAAIIRRLYLHCFSSFFHVQPKYSTSLSVLSKTVTEKWLRR